MDTLSTAIQRAKRHRNLPPPAIRKQIRERLGLSQMDIASVLGVDRVSVCRYETGKRRPRGVVLDRYLDVLDRFIKEGLQA